MEFKNFSPETVAELLIYLADNDKFDSLKNLKEFSKGDVTNVLRELADQLKTVAATQPVLKKENVRQKDLTDNINRVVGKLTPHEENLLFKSFKIS